MVVKNSWTEEQIIFIIQEKLKKRSWSEIVIKLNKKFNLNRSFNSVEKAYRVYKDYISYDTNYVKTIKDLFRAKQNNSRIVKESKAIINVWNNLDDVIDSIGTAVKSISSHKYKVPKMPGKSRTKKDMTMELLFSDVHYGKLIEDIDGNNVNLDIIRQRVQKISHSIVKEIKRESNSFNVERIILSMMGDIIENADFHGKESTKSCEFGTSKQVQEAITSIFLDLILPIAMTGIKVHIPCITGNHDRLSMEKTYVKPGEDNLSYIIYKTLELLCKQSNLKNVTFKIESAVFTHYNIYDNLVVVEHGEELKNINRTTMATQMAKRQAQLGKVVHFYRVGHWHEPTQYGQGKMMVNGSVPGQDSYAQSKGFCSEAVQILNYYVKTDKRNTCFFRSFPIYLQNKQ